ncbi:MAG: hypothetical protein B6244_11500 [Candidatus Cloacimonetes bacterium 4572_55]|nr:MAG: hypothetical protein B6244_11500 [Candidatus Cloacimonetes bacterium 4572_55]
MTEKKFYILIVDDEKDNLELLERTLRREYHILKAANGAEGLKMLEKNQVDLIITDQRMPNMTGIEMLAETIEKYPDVIRIVLTGYTDVDDLIDAINQGHVYRYITKPWEPRELKITVKRALESYQLHLENKRLLEDLIRSEKLATVGQLAGSIAHEIKNQLVGIMFAELIQEKYPDDPEIQSYIRYILDAYHHILNMVDEIRDFARQRKEDLETELTSIESIIDNAIDLCNMDKNLKFAQIIKKFDQDISIHLHREKIKQVLLNLLKNAVHAIDPDSGKIHIGLAREKSKVVLSVSDNGCGIPIENLNKIWEPFFTTKDEHGTGLGLDICRKIIEEHKGTITVKSEVKSGTTFTIYLPILFLDNY